MVGLDSHQSPQPIENDGTYTGPTTLILPTPSSFTGKVVRVDVAVEGAQTATLWVVQEDAGGDIEGVRRTELGLEAGRNVVHLEGLDIAAGEYVAIDLPGSGLAYIVGGGQSPSHWTVPQGTLSIGDPVSKSSSNGILFQFRAYVATPGLAVARGPIVTPTSAWAGRNWTAIGTSISAQGHYTAPLQALLGASLTNLAIGGQTTPQMITDQIPSITPDAELVTLEVGTNDFPSGLPLGDLTDTSPTTFYGAVLSAVQAIADRAPDALIVLMTPFSAGPGPNGTMEPHIASRTYLADNSGTRLHQWQQAVRDVATLTGWPLIDIGRDSGINYWTIGAYSYDGLHVIGEGGERMAAFIATRLAELAPRAPAAIGTDDANGRSGLDPNAAGSSAILSNDNRDLSTAGTGSWTSARGAQGRSSGAYYFEAEYIEHGVANGTIMGVATADTDAAGLNTFPGNFSASAGFRRDGIFETADFTEQAGFTPFGPLQGDILQVAVDLDGGSIWFGHNGAWIGGSTPAIGSAAGRLIAFPAGLTLFPVLSVSDSGNTVRLRATSQDLSYSVPPGFSAWA